MTAALARFEAKYEVADSGCWIWTAGGSARGYGSFDGTTAHRWSYEHHVGPIPHGLQIDHLCCTPACVNPAHLEPVTLEENMRRRAQRKTHCKRGHELAGDNVRVRPNGARQCRTCQREIYDVGRAR